MKLSHSLNRPVILALTAIVVVMSIGTGCAYYNTFYNIKKEFRAAEKQTQRALAGSTGPAALGQEPSPPDRPGQNLGPIQQYQTIIQSCGKLLEFYPKSRWVDDALMVMGISYFRVQEFSRAERKFTELVTIFPKSKHAQIAIVWRARALVAQNKLDEAENVIVNDQAKIVSPGAKAASIRTLAEIAELRKQPVDAVTYLEQIKDISYNRDEKATDYLRLGRSYVLLERIDDAKVALERCLDLTRVATEAFFARKILAELAADQNSYLEAKSYLLPLRVDRRFIEQAGEIEVELARVEARAGDPLIAIQMLEQYCANATAGETKARAFYLQGEVARNRLGNFELAKSKFDSVGAAGASRALQDSARQASAQLESGLNALARIPGLTDSLQTLIDNPPAVEVEAEVIELPANELEAVQPEAETDTTTIDYAARVSVDSTTIEFPDTMRVDSSLVTIDALSDSSLVQDTTRVDSSQAKIDSLSDSSSDQVVHEMSPAELIADSIMRSIIIQDSIKKVEQAVDDSSTLVAIDSTALLVEEATEVAAPRGPTAQERYLDQVAQLSGKLVAAHLEAASFFELVAMNKDSALAHLESAAAVPDSSDDHWRSRVQLGIILFEQEGEYEARGRDLLSEVAETEAAPHGIRNIAYRKLGLPELAPIETEQARSLRHAEQLLLSDGSIDDVLSAYRETVLIDSHSHEGSQALHAIAYFQEYRANDFESARATHEAIVRLFPDSSFTQRSKTKIAEPDSNSVFLLSDEALEATYQPAAEILSAKADSTGWPPDEETLRGRRFR